MMLRLAPLTLEIASDSSNCLNRNQIGLLAQEHYRLQNYKHHHKQPLLLSMKPQLGSIPSIAIIAPSPIGTAVCIALPRILTSLTASVSDNALQMHITPNIPLKNAQQRMPPYHLKLKLLSFRFDNP